MLYEMGESRLKVLFLVCPSLGIGEIYTCIKLDQQLRRNGVTTHFIGPRIITAFKEIQNNSYCIFSKDMKQNFEIFSDTIDEFQPDLLVFTDYHMYLRNEYSRQVFDFEWVKRYNIPCIVIDTLGNCRFEDVNTSIYSDSNFSLTLPDWVSAIIRPSPPHDPVLGEKENKVLFFPVFDSDPDIDEKRIVQLKQQFSINMYKKSVIFPFGHWVKHVLNDTMYSLYKNLEKIILHYLSLLDTEIDVYILGESLFSSKSHKKVCIRTDFVDLPLSDGDDLLSACDLVISVNRLSNSLGRAAHYQVPTLTLVNSRDIEVRDGKIMSELDYEISPFIQKTINLVTRRNGNIDKYMIFPENKVDFIECFYNKNIGFNKVNPIQELFDEKSVINVLKGLLFDKRRLFQTNQLDYMRKTYALPSIYNQIKEYL